MHKSRAAKTKMLIRLLKVTHTGHPMSSVSDALNPSPTFVCLTLRFRSSVGLRLSYMFIFCLYPEYSWLTAEECLSDQLWLLLRTVSFSSVNLQCLEESECFMNGCWIKEERKELKFIECSLYKYFSYVIGTSLKEHNCIRHVLQVTVLHTSCP